MGTLELQNTESALVALLAGSLSVSASTRVPNPRPATFVRVQRTGGDEANMVQERPVHLIECWSNGPTPAWQLAASAWRVLSGREPLVSGGVEFSQRQLSLPVNYPDPSTAQDRYQFTMQSLVNLVAPTTP